MTMAPFCPSPTYVNINVSASTQSVKICDQMGSYQVRLMNNGTVTAWFRFGDKNVTADIATGTPLAAGAAEVFTVLAPYNGPTYLAVIAAGATGFFYATPGAGI